MPETAERGADRTPLFIVTTLVAVAFIAALAAQAPGLNGPRSWPWRWRDLGLFAVGTRMFVPFLALAAVHRRLILRVDEPRPALVLPALVLCCIALATGALLAEPRGFERFHDLVTSRTATSYYADALEIDDSRTFLATFHDVDLTLHSATHPPGPILFFYGVITLFGADRAAYAAGAAVVVLSALVIPAFYFFAALWLPAPRTRLVACSYYALTPTVLVFHPALDTIFTIAALALTYAWQRTISKDPASLHWAALTGSALFVVTLLAYNLLTIGLLLLVLAGYHLLGSEDRRRAALDILVAAVVCLAVLVAEHVLFHLATGYRPVASFAHALELQSQELARLRRPYFSGLFYDLYGFFVLGAGVVTVPLLAAVILDAIRSAGAKTEMSPYALVALTAPFLVDLTGLLPGETSRVWSFLYPFVLLPIGTVLAAFSPRRQLTLLALQWLFLVVAKANILFMSPY